MSKLIGMIVAPKPSEVGGHQVNPTEHACNGCKQIVLVCERSIQAMNKIGAECEFWCLDCARNLPKEKLPSAFIDLRNNGK